MRNNIILGIIIVALLLVTIFWFHYDLSKFRKDVGKHEIISSETDSKQAPDKMSVEKAQIKETDSPTDMHPQNNMIPEDILALDTSLEPEKLNGEQSVAENVPVSPYGFGPYPELPPPWPRDYWDGVRSKGHELIGRVRIKLYEEGVWADGMHRDDNTGMIHPIYQDTVYVEWGHYTNPDGTTERYITSSLGHPDTMDVLEKLRYPPEIMKEETDKIPRTLGLIRESDLPTDIKFLTYDEGAIDPYEYLNLEKEN